MVRLDAYAESSPHVERDGQYVKAFRMTKFPITNRQYQTFIQDPEGYANEVWWRFSPQAVAWRTANPKPKPSQFKGDDRPRETVNWFDAMAFCSWLGKRLEKESPFQLSRNFSARYRVMIVVYFLGEWTSSGTVATPVKVE
jgi:formylglycine-generating enzyme required for sulfatase activity